MTSEPAPEQPEAAPAARAEPAPPAPVERPTGFAPALGFFAFLAANGAGWDRVLSLVLDGRALRGFQLSVVYAGKVVHEKPLLGQPGARAYSYAFLGQEALSIVAQLLVAAAAFVYVRRSLPRPFALDRAILARMAKVGSLLGGAFSLAALVAGLVSARVHGGAPLRAFLDGLDMALLVDPKGRLLALVGFVFVAPLTEELVFRGVVYRALRRLLDVPTATIVQAALFGACHLGTGLDAPLIAIPYFWGIAAAVLFERTRSLGPAILLHALGNAAALVVVAFVMGFTPEIYDLLGGR